MNGQETDWSSMASSLIPGVLGLLGGGGPAGALAGYAHGQESQDAYRRETEKTNREIGYKNEDQRRQAQQANAEQKHWENMDMDAESLAKYRGSQMEQINRQVEEAKKSDTAWEGFVSDLPPDQQKAARAYGYAGREKFLDPYVKGKLEPIDRAGSSTLLQRHMQMTKEDADQLVGSMTADEVRKIPEQMMTARANRQPYHIVDWETGSLIERYPDGRIVRTPGVVTPRPKIATNLSPAQTRQTEKDLRTRWEKEQGMDLFSKTPEEITQDYERWRQSPEGDITFDRASGGIAREKVEAPVIPPKSVEDEATGMMRQAYMAANQKSGFSATDQTFEKWAKTDAGRKRFNEYKDFVRRQRGGRGTATPEYPVERQNQPPIAPAASAPKKPAATTKRKSLDEIAKEAFGNALGG